MNAPTSPFATPSVRAPVAAFAATIFFLFVFSVASVEAQTPPPRVSAHVGYVYPAGGRQGTTVTVSLGGQNLAGATAAVFTGRGLVAKVGGYERPLTQKEINDLREKLQELQEKRTAARAAVVPEPKTPAAPSPATPAPATATDAKSEPAPPPVTTTATAAVTPAPPPPFTAEDEKMLVEIRTKLAGRPNRPANPALAETVTLEVTLAADAPPGDHELRLLTSTGLSNPVVFRVGESPEFADAVVTATMNPAPRPNQPADPRNARAPSPELTVTLPATVNGQILPGEVDRFRFAAHQGQRLTVAVAARALLPYLADAVPGWFQAAVALRGPDGREVAYSDHFEFNPDPMLAFVAPADGDYVLEIRDALYRGREDFVYRIAIGELPIVTGIFPLGGSADKNVVCEIDGWNLAAAHATIDTHRRGAGTAEFAIADRGQHSNPVMFAIDARADVAEAESNHSPATAQPLTLPVIVNGRIAQPGERDVFRFEGHSGEEIVAEVFARRLNSPLDSFLTVTDATGHVLASNDDTEDKGAGLTTHHADSRVTLTLPADGAYFVTVRDTENHGGPHYAYRLRVGAPQPDFALRVTPASVNLRAGGSAPLTVYALRRDGFAGEIQLGLRDAPKGFALSGARIPAGQDQITLTLVGPPTPRDEPLSLTMIGVATIAGQRVGRLAVPAEDMMQAFAYHHLVPAQSWQVAVAGKAPSFRVASALPVQIPLGGSAKIRVTGYGARFVENLNCTLAGAPEGLTVTTLPGSGEGFEVVVACEAAKLKAGAQGNLLLQVFGERTNNQKEKANAANRGQRQPLGSVPAVPFEIVPSRAPAPASAG